MSDPENTCSSSATTEESHQTQKMSFSGSDESFFRSLEEFIQQERSTVAQKCPELRYITYRSVFNKVIGRATAYKRLLLTVKAEYDDVIGALQRREEEVGRARRAVAASTSHPKSLMTCHRRAAHLRERISVVDTETAELEEEIKRQKSREAQSTWIPGLTVAESEDPDALDRHLRHLEAQRDALLDTRSHCVPLELKARLDAELQAAEDRRDELRAKNNQQRVLYKRLRLVFDRLSGWEDELQRVPLEELLGSTLEKVTQASAADDDARSIDAELFEHEEPNGVDESRLLADKLDRFVELVDSAQYEDAALLAARAPGGVLRNLDTMEMFKDVEGTPGSLPPLFLFLQALLMSVPAGDQLPADLSLPLVHCFLQRGATQLVTFAVNNNKLTFSEDLGDVLAEHAQKNPGVADVCLALASVVYEACRLDRKTALSMCRRGFIHSAAEFMNYCEDLTAEDCMWVLCRSPSLSLLQLLTEPQQEPAAILSVGVACSTLLADPQQQQQQQLALQLLDSFVSRGRGVLEEAILQDSSSSVDVWTNVANRCSELNRADLSRAVLSVMLDQSGTRVLTPDREGGRLMEHVFL